MDNVYLCRVYRLRVRMIAVSPLPEWLDDETLSFASTLSFIETCYDLRHVDSGLPTATPSLICLCVDAQLATTSFELCSGYEHGNRDTRIS